MNSGIDVQSNYPASGNDKHAVQRHFAIEGPQIEITVVKNQ